MVTSQAACASTAGVAQSPLRGRHLVSSAEAALLNQTRWWWQQRRPRTLSRQLAMHAWLLHCP